MQLNLTDFKENRPSIAPLFDYIENAALTQMEVSGYSSTIPYPDNLVNYNRLFLPLFLYSPDSKEFVSLLNLFADWYERLSLDYPNIALINMLINKHREMISKLRSVVASDDTPSRWPGRGVREQRPGWRKRCDRPGPQWR